MIKIRFPRQTAFTLVELLVVIGIIAILVSLLLPAVNRARQQANTTACLANLRSLGQSINIYTVQNKGTLPYGFWDGVGQPDGAMAGGVATAGDWATLLLGSVLTKGGTNYADAAPSDKSRLQKVFSCPTAYEPNGDVAYDRKLHYNVHPRLMPDLDMRDPSSTLPPAQRPLMRPYQISKIKRSSDIIMMMDGAQIGMLNGNCYSIATAMDDDGLFRNDTQNGRQWNYLRNKPGLLGLNFAIYTPNQDYFQNYYEDKSTNMRWRHGRNDVCNFLYADGHANSQRLKFGKNADVRLLNVYID